ncbi:MAG TPA: hypothetical protein VHS06_06600 [Chloroflexota bacterium]|nr:hypothetical protein [Chloroflexota bacterium]
MILDYWGQHRGVHVNPPRLDACLKNRKGYTDDKGVIQERAVECGREFGIGNLSAVKPYKDKNTLISDLLERIPAKLQVQEFHHVLALGVSDAPNGDDTFYISDPAVKSTKPDSIDRYVPLSMVLYDRYNNDYIQAMSAYDNPAASKGSFALRLFSPAELLVRDAQGRRSGIDPRTGAKYDEMPDCVYYEDGIDDHSSQPLAIGSTKTFYCYGPQSGRYDIQVIGIGTGSYRVEVLAYDDTGQPSTGELSGQAQQGAVDSYRAEYSSVPGVPVRVGPTNEPPTLTAPASLQVEYSDNMLFMVSATDPDDSSSDLRFSAKGLPADLTLTDNLNGTASVSGTVTASAWTYPVDLTVTDPHGLTDTKQVSVVVAKEKAATEYTGSLFALTSSMTSLTTQLQLAARLTEEADGAAGDPTKAKVTFELFKSSNLSTTPDQVISGVPVNADGTAQTMVSLGVDSWVVNVKISSDNGYWTTNSVGSSVVMVALPDPSRRVVGGGWIPYDGSLNGKANFGFTVNYQKTGNPKGQSVFVYGSKGDGFNYVIKSNSWQGGGLGFASDPSKATFSGKCTVQKIDRVTGSVAPSWGNYSYTVGLTDGDQANPKGPDKFAITIMDANNNVWKQVGTANLPVQLGGGQVTVQSK